MIKKLLCFFFLLASIQQLSAQQLMHSFGATVSAITGRITTPYSSSSFALSQTMFSYFPRYNFVENENSSVSVGMPVAAGLGISTNTYSDEKGIAFAYDLPVVLDYNIGCKSTFDNEGTFGGYFGLGFGYHKVSISKSENSDFSGASYGPLVRAGVRFSSYAESWAGHGLTIGMFYKKGMEKEKFKTFGFNVLYDL